MKISSIAGNHVILDTTLNLFYFPINAMVGELLGRERCRRIVFPRSFKVSLFNYNIMMKEGNSCDLCNDEYRLNYRVRGSIGRENDVAA